MAQAALDDRVPQTMTKTLKRLRENVIQVGLRLPGDLCDSAGGVLFGSGVMLSEAHMALLGRWLGSGIYGGQEWPKAMVDPVAESQPAESRAPRRGSRREPASMPSRDKTVVQVASLKPGSQLLENLYDLTGVLLLSAGSEVTPRFLDLLSRRDIQTVKLRPAHLPPTEVRGGSKAAWNLDNLLTAELNRLGSVKPTANPKRKTMPLNAMWREAKRGLEGHADASNLLGELCDDLCGGKRVSGDEVRRQIARFSDMIDKDCDLLLTIVAMQQSKDDYLFDHGVNVAMIAMTMAAQLGCTPEEVLQVGIGGFLHDIGMLRVPPEIRSAERLLTAEEFKEVKRHPIYTLDHLEWIRRLPTSAKFIGYQAHEREDGSGYPRGRSGKAIHPFAKIVAVADIYAAMTSDRPHRPAFDSHHAIAAIISATRKKRLDPVAVRAFLDTMSAFPIGSLVELNNQLKARVVRPNPTEHLRPIVMPVDDQGQAIVGGTIDLMQNPGLSVVGTWRTS